MRGSQLSPWECRVFKVKTCTLASLRAINTIVSPLVNELRIY